MENVIDCLSFCELSHLISGKENVESIIKSAMKIAGFNKVERLYAGSNFCCRYFLFYAEKFFKNTETFLLKNDLKVTLCIPIFSEDSLVEGKQLIIKLLEDYDTIIDEVTVNDYGFLLYAHEHFNKKINIGRMLNKVTRDIRYPDYFNKPYSIKLDNSYCSKYDINSYEVDLTNRFMDLTADEKQVAVYVPYCFATVGNICEFASSNLPLEKKFRPNEHCSHNCNKIFIDYFNSNGLNYIKIGRTIYFRVLDYSIRSSRKYRKIYQPIELLIEEIGEKNE